MAAPLLAGLVRTLGSQIAKKGAKKIAVKKIKSKAKERISGKNNQNKKLSKKSALISSKGDRLEEKLLRSKISEEETTPTLTGTPKKLTIKSAPKSESQIEQLKINVTNIHKFLVKSNRDYARIESKNKRLSKRAQSKIKLGREERQLEKERSPFGKSLKNVKDSVASGAGSMFEKVLEFGALLLAGIIVNALPAIIEKVQEIIDNIVNFLTPIQSGFNLIKGFFTGEIDESKYDADKKRVDDKLVELNKDGGLIDQIAEQTGILEPLVKALKPAIEQVRNVVGGKNKVLAVKSGKEGVKDLDTGEFTERQFTSAERKKFEKGDATVDGGKPTVKADKFLDDPKGISGSQLVVTSEMGLRDLALSPGMHMGVDIAGPEGTPLVSFSRGTVTAKGYDGGYGNYVVWTDDQNIEHFYGHLKNPSPVNIGDSLIKGQIVGLMGNTGRSSGPHLHWETSTVIGDTGRPKGAVLSRFNPLSKYGKLDPFKIEQIKNSTESSTGKGGANISVKPKDMIINPDPRKRRGSMTVAVQQVNTIQTAYVPMPIPMKSKSFSSSSSPQLSPIWA